MRLPRSYTMAQRGDFIRVREEGQKSVGRYLVVSKLSALEIPHWKYAVITSRKVGKAHERNAIRRLVREVLIKHGSQIKEPCFIITIARWRAREADFRAIEKDWLRQARRLQILTRP